MLCGQRMSIMVFESTCLPCPHRLYTQFNFLLPELAMQNSLSKACACGSKPVGQFFQPGQELLYATTNSVFLVSQTALISHVKAQYWLRCPRADNKKHLRQSIHRSKVSRKAELRKVRASVYARGSRNPCVGSGWDECYTMTWKT